MANIVSPNNSYASASSTEAIWRLTRVMKAAGWTTVACSNGTTKVAPADNTTDNWGNNVNPSFDSYPGFSASGVFVPWIVMRGPSTLKIPITAAPTGTPMRGEKITQGGAEGELLGYVFDSQSSTGWMVVCPRVGTFTNSGTITGAISAATFVPNGTIVTYVREFMFSRSNVSSDVTNHQIFYICADVVNESAQLFSTLATTTNASTIVPPGCSSTGTNQFPALGIVVRGIAGTPNPGSAPVFPAIGTLTTGSYHAGCANATGSAGVSPDGSFYLAGWTLSTNPGMSGFGYTRVDDGDPGDCDPYVVLGACGVILSSWSRTNPTTAGSIYTWSGNSLLYNYSPFVGYQARGCPITYRDVASAYLGMYYSPSTFVNGFPTPNRSLNHPATTPPSIRENVMFWSQGAVPNVTTGTPMIHKQYKGKARWWFQVTVGTMCDTYDSKKLLCTGTGTISAPAIIIGPWDTATTPTS